jgi:hypothetical protein
MRKDSFGIEDIVGRFGNDRNVQFLRGSSYFSRDDDQVRSRWNVNADGVSSSQSDSMAGLQHLDVNALGRTPDIAHGPTVVDTTVLKPTHRHTTDIVSTTLAKLHAASSFWL